MCILTLASHLVSATFLELVESSQEKMSVSFGETNILATSSSMSKPLPARALCPGSKGSKNNGWLSSACLPVTLPSQAEEKKLVTPCGLVAMNMLALSECLYCDLVADLATRFGGVSTSTL